MTSADRLVAGLCATWIAALGWIMHEQRPLTIDWDAVAAVGTAAAVVVALWTTQRGERRQRKRDEAVLHVAIVSIANAAMVIEQFRAHAQAGESVSDLAKTYIQLGSIDVPVGGLASIVLAELPSPNAVDHALAARHALDVTARQLVAVSKGGDPDLLYAQIEDLRESEDALRQELRL